MVFSGFILFASCFLLVLQFRLVCNACRPTTLENYGPLLYYGSVCVQIWLYKKFKVSQANFVLNFSINHTASSIKTSVVIFCDCSESSMEKE